MTESSLHGSQGKSVPLSVISSHPGHHAPPWLFMAWSNFFSSVLNLPLFSKMSVWNGWFDGQALVWLWFFSVCSGPSYVLFPPLSHSQFGFFNENETVVEMKNQEVCLFSTCLHYRLYCFMSMPDTFSKVYTHTHTHQTHNETSSLMRYFVWFCQDSLINVFFK